MRVEFGAWASAIAELVALEAHAGGQDAEAQVLDRAAQLARDVIGCDAVRFVIADGRASAPHAGADNGRRTAAVHSPMGELLFVMEADGAGDSEYAADASLEAFADELGAIVDRVRLRVRGDHLAAKERHRASQQRRLADTALALTAADSVDEVLELVTRAAQDIIGTHQAVSSRLVHGWQQATTHVSLSDKYAAWRDYDDVPKGLGVLNYVTRENRPLRLTAEELRAHPEFRGLADAPGHPPLPDYLAVPLVARDGSNLGLIQLSDALSGEPFDADDEAILVQLAQLASSVVEGIEALESERRAREHLEHQRRRAQALEQVGRAITGGRDLRETVQLATEAATELTGAKFGAFFYNVENEHGEAYTLYTIAGAALEHFSKFPMPRKTQVFAPTFNGETIVRADDILVDPRYGHNAPHQGLPEGHLPVRSYLAVPVITTEGEVAGGMFFGHPDPAMFDDEAEEAAVSIAAQAAVALVNGRLFDAVQRELHARRKALDVLQESLLPPALPDVPGVEVAARYRPGREQVGGDFYDLFSLGGRRWAIALGDVCGSGPEAAARTALTRHSVRTAAMYETSPASVLATLNEALLRDGSQRFSTALFGALDLSSAESVRVTMSTGGHPPPVILHASGDVEEAALSGQLLGVVEHPSLEDTELTLCAGDALVFFTDGLTEARCAGRQFGLDGVMATVQANGEGSCEEIADALVAAAEEHAEHGLDDDLAVVVLRITPGRAA